MKSTKAIKSHVADYFTTLKTTQHHCLKEVGTGPIIDENLCIHTIYKARHGRSN